MSHHRTGGDDGLFLKPGPAAWMNSIYHVLPDVTGACPFRQIDYGLVEGVSFCAVGKHILSGSRS